MHRYYHQTVIYYNKLTFHRKELKYMMVGKLKWKLLNFLMVIFFFFFMLSNINTLLQSL